MLDREGNIALRTVGHCFHCQGVRVRRGPPRRSRGDQESLGRGLEQIQTDRAGDSDISTGAVFDMRAFEIRVPATQMELPPLAVRM
jgi:hypothetical protein